MCVRETQTDLLFIQPNPTLAYLEFKHITCVFANQTEWISKSVTYLLTSDMGIG